MKQCDEPKYRQVEDQQRLELRPKNIKKARHAREQVQGEQAPQPSTAELAHDLPADVPQAESVEAVDADLVDDLPEEPASAEAGIEKLVKHLD